MLGKPLACLRSEMVRAEGLEPPRLATLEPKSSASTSSATRARTLLQRWRAYSKAGRRGKRGRLPACCNLLALLAFAKVRRIKITQNPNEPQVPPETPQPQPPGQPTQPPQEAPPVQPDVDIPAPQPASDPGGPAPGQPIG